MSGTCLTDISASDVSSGNESDTDINTRHNQNKSRRVFGSRFKLHTAFKDTSTATTPSVFKTSENSNMATIFSKTRKESNIEKQRRMMATAYGSANELPSASDMDLQTLRVAKELGMKPHHIPLLSRSIARVKDMPANIARRSLNLNSVSAGGKLHLNHESIDEIICRNVDLKAVFSLLETGRFTDARDWLSTIQKTPTIAPSTHEVVVTWIFQLYIEAFALAHINGKAIVALTALVDEIPDASLRKRFMDLLSVQTSSFDIMNQHIEALLSLKSAIKYSSDPTAFQGFRNKLKKRAAEYKLKTASSETANFSHYNDILLSSEDIESRLAQNRQMYNRKRRDRLDSRKRSTEQRRQQNRYRDRRSERPPEPKLTNRKAPVPPRPTFDPKRTRTCFKCGGKGHIASHCPQAVCTYCNRKGHTVTVCRKKQRDEEGKNATGKR